MKYMERNSGVHVWGSLFLLTSNKFKLHLSAINVWQNEKITVHFSIASRRLFSKTNIHVQ